MVEVRMCGMYLDKDRDMRKRPDSFSFRAGVQITNSGVDVILSDRNLYERLKKAFEAKERRLRNDH